MMEHFDDELSPLPEMEENDTFSPDEEFEDEELEFDSPYGIGLSQEQWDEVQRFLELIMKFRKA